MDMHSIRQMPSCGTSLVCFSFPRRLVPSFRSGADGCSYHRDGAGFGRLQAARDLLLSLPPNLTSHAVAFDAEGPELVHFRRFFEVWDGFAGLAEVRASEPGDPAQKMEALEWRKLYSVSAGLSEFFTNAGVATSQ